MARVVNIHPESPQQRLLAQAADFIRKGAIVALPTDSCYALGCHLGDREALDRIRQIREMDERHHLTLMVRDLSEIAHFARVDNPKRKTIGLRVPDHPVALALLEELNEPLLTTTLQLPGDEFPLTEGWEIQDRLDDLLELILDGGHCGTEPTTIIDLTGSAPELIRAGRGPLELFGLG